MKVQIPSLEVVARHQVSEKNFAGKKRHIHTQKGGRGFIHFNNRADLKDMLEGAPTVEWCQTETLTRVGLDEIELTPASRRVLRKFFKSVQRA